MSDFKFDSQGFSRRGLLKATGYGTLAALVGSAMGPMSFAFAAGQPIKTVRPGYLTAACLGDMPLGALREGVPVGTDLELLKIIADRLELKLDVLTMGFPAVVEAVRSGRADWFGGNFAWNPMRSKILLLTDPVFYTGAYVIMRDSEPFDTAITVNDVKGRTIGAITGYFTIPDMKKIEGVKEVKLYDNTDSCLRDVRAGRLDFAVLDAPTIDYMILQDPSLKLKQIPMSYDEKFPSLTAKFEAIWGVHPQNQDLFDGINQGLRWLKATDQIRPILAKYGIKNPDYLVPPAKDPRIGVDRDEKGNLIGPFEHPPRDFSQAFA
ncbi:polar amino acid transport system substrate-binding protein [Pseudomonas sp. JAI111]|jgi:polar amino acid transport system substrate-binding protein|uniref:ABC transporter substrate-binding protein n=1 Tax=unclassified Pseudomonas TaxID=196821 RepID=UPI001C99F3B2|nr:MULTISPECIES: transporter substrate-binding domain-containing protein [unclassified Pseudomonas]MCS3838586.1 polar amino acid transport system substrate-binding protein [Pseudomonas sp. JAI111]QZP32070.1 transporter substrate-binding domain-containing protein [Pseudomonas sp. DR48]